MKKTKGKNHAARAAHGSVGSRIVRGLTQVRDTLQAGQNLEERFTVRTIALELRPRPYDAAAVRAVRGALGTSQAVFGQILGVGPNTIAAWEQGVRVPSPMACRFLDEIRRDLDAWRSRLRAAALTG